MSIVTIDDSYFTDIANAIRGKNGETTTYKPNEMAAAISAISSGGSGNITQWGKMFFSSSPSQVNLSSIVADYSKIDFMFFSPGKSSYDSGFIYFPGLTSPDSRAAGYIPMLRIDSSGNIWSDSRSKFIAPSDYQTESIYFFKQSEFDANGILKVYYLANSTHGGMSSPEPSGFIGSNSSVYIFYH